MAFDCEVGAYTLPTVAGTPTVSTSSVADPTVITTATAHGLATTSATNRMGVTISGHTGSTPDINGVHEVTVLSPTTFSIPVNVSSGGTGGTIAPTVILDDSGITPKVVWHRTTASTSDGNYQDGAFFSLGWGDLTTEFSCGTFSEDNVGTSNVVRSIQDNMLTRMNAPQAVSSSSVANPTVITMAAPHGYSNGDLVSIAGHNDVVPNINQDEHTISNVTTNTFTIPVNVITGGTGGFATVVTERVSLVSFSAGSFVISVDVAGAAITVEYMVWGGSDLEGVFIGSFLAPTSSGEFSVSDNPFSGERPSAVFFMTSQSSNDANVPPFIKPNDVESAFTFGFAGTVKQNASQMADCRMYSSDAEATMETLSREGTGERCFSQFAFKGGGWAGDGEFAFVSMDTDGFTLRQDAGAVPAIAYFIPYLAVKGSNWEAVEATVPSTRTVVSSSVADPTVITTAGAHNLIDGETVTITGHSGSTPDINGDHVITVTAADKFTIPVNVTVGGNGGQAKPSSTQPIINSGFTPDGAIFTMANANPAAMMHGWASNDGGSKPFPEGVAYQSDDDAVATSDAKRLTRLDRCLTNAFAGSTTNIALADLDSWNSDGLDLEFPTADVTQRYHVIMFGAAGTPFEGGTGTEEGMIMLV